MKDHHPECNTCSCFSSCLFKSYSEEEINNLINSKSCRTFGKNQIIYLEGEKPQGVWCIASGKIKITKTNREGREQIIRIARSGNNLGYHSVITGGCFSDSAIVLEEAQVCFIPKADFLGILRHNSSVCTDVLYQLSLDFIEAEQLIKYMAFKSVRERMADAFLLLKRTYDHTDNSDLRISISRGDLANLIGTAKETTARLLTEFREDKIIDLEGRDIRIKDWEKIQKISRLYD